MAYKHILAAALFLSVSLPALSEALECDTIFFDDGAWYCGGIADSLFNGYGTMLYSDSTLYSGQWESGMWNGQGTLTFPDGDTYSGHFLNHEFDGEGQYTYHNGAKYDGQWKNGMFHGAGRMEYADGSTYAGLWEYDMREGYGVLYDAASKTLYRGEFHEDQFTDWAGDDSSLNGTEEIEDREDMMWMGVVSYSLDGNLALGLDCRFTEHFLAGLSIGFNTKSHGKGEPSVLYDDETGERNVLVDWDWHKDEIVMEHEYEAFLLYGECLLRGKRLGIGGAAGIGIRNAVRDCRGLGNENSYFEKDQLYFRKKIVGVDFGYRLFTDVVVKDMTVRGERLLISARAGYGNLDNAFIGLELCY